MLQLTTKHALTEAKVYEPEQVNVNEMVMPSLDEDADWPEVPANCDCYYVRGTRRPYPGCQAKHPKAWGGSE